jgi:hypothetical protein
MLELFREIIGKEEVGRHRAEARSLFQWLGSLPIGIAWPLPLSARMCATRQLAWRKFFL